MPDSANEVKDFLKVNITGGETRIYGSAPLRLVTLRKNEKSDENAKKRLYSRRDNGELTRPAGVKVLQHVQEERPLPTDQRVYTSLYQFWRENIKADTF